MQKIHLLDIWIWKGAKQNWNAHMANFPSSLQRLFNFLLYLEWKQLVKPKTLVKLLWSPSYILNMHLQILFQDKENPKGQGNIFRKLWKDRCATLKLRCWASHEPCTIFLLFCIWHSHCSIRMVKAKDLHSKTKKQQTWSLILKSMALISSAMQHAPNFTCKEHLQAAAHCFMLPFHCCSVLYKKQHLPVSYYYYSFWEGSCSVVTVGFPGL